MTQKIIRAAAHIASHRDEKLQLGNLEIHRDWGWAPDYVNAMWLMLQTDEPQDLVIATGRTVSLAYFVERAFAHFDLDWRDHVRSDPSLLRPSDIAFGAGDPALAATQLGWKASHDVDDVIRLMCSASVDRRQDPRA